MPRFRGTGGVQDASITGSLLSHSLIRRASTLTAADDTASAADRDAGFQLKQTYAIGFRSCGRNVVEFLTESLVVYPVAHHVALFNIETTAMEFLHHTKTVRSVQCFHVSPNREFIAVAEIHHTSPSSQALAILPSSSTSTGVASSPAKPAASLAVSTHLHEQHQTHVLCIYKAATRSRVRTIALPHNSTIVSCSFSACNKFLALLEDAPTHNVTYWKVSTAKLIASCKCPSRGARIHIAPTNASFLSVSGPMVLKYWIWTKTEFRIGNFVPPLREHEHFVDHVWVKELMVALSEKGLVMCFRATADGTGVDLVHSYRCHHLSYVRMECITVHAKGFVLGGSAGFFSLYETSDDPTDPFALVRNVSVGDVAFENIAISPSIETTVVCTKSQELLTFAMSSIDTVQEDRVAYREFTRHGYQVGGIIQIDTCIQRPIVATCGTDKSVRVWNYELRQYEVLHACPEEPQALALHPSGFQVLVAFKERVRVYNVLVASLRQVRELPIKMCRALRFARGGHLFACAAGLTVLVFRSYTFELVHTFAGHIGAVRCLAWSKDDVCLYSAAHDGAVYRWNLTTGSRSDDMQLVVKQCQYAALVADERDAKVVVAGGSDGKVREITVGEETAALDLAPGVCVTSMALTRDNRRLFVGTNIGSVLVYAWPLSSSTSSSRSGATTVVDTFAHAEAVTHLSVTEDNESLVSCSDDGSICVFKISASVGSGSGSSGGGTDRVDAVDTVATQSTELIKQQDKRHALIAFADTLLVAREDLDDRDAALVDLRQQYDQVRADIEFALHRKESEWIDRLRVVKDESEALVVQERLRYEELETRHQLAGRKHIEELGQKAASHVKLTQELANQYEHKLAQELARYDALAESLEQTRQQCAALLEAQDATHRGTLHGERKATHARTKEQNDVIKRLHDDLTYNHVKFEEVLAQEETEYEHELARVRVECAALVERERQNTAITQGHVSATHTKLESLQKKIQELKASSLARDVLLSTEQAKTAKLEATLAHYEQHVATCAYALADKGKALRGLASSNRVLESFRTVLAHRVDSLEVAKAPMQTHMLALEDHIASMQTELVDEFEAKAVVAKDTEHKDGTIKMLRLEVTRLRQNARKHEYAAGEMTRELTRLAQLTNLKELDVAVKDAYRSLVMGEHVHKKPPTSIALVIAAKQQHDDDVTSATSASKSVTKRKAPLFGSIGTSALSPARRSSTLQTRVSTAPSPAKSKFSRIDLAASDTEQQRGGRSAASDEVLGYDCKQAVDESVKQVEYMSRTVQTLRSALENAKLKTDRVRRDAIAEGSVLIDECNTLRKEQKRLLLKIRELEHAVIASGGRSPLATSGPVVSAPDKDMAASASCPELLTPLQLSSPERDSGLDASSTPSKLLVPLTAIALSKNQHQQRKHAGVLPVAGGTSLSSRHGGTGNNVLPFARLEREREQRSGRVAKADDLAQLVERQRKEIQRLQTQVQLLLTADDSSEPQCGSARTLQLSSKDRSLSFSLLPPTAASASPNASARHPGGLRPIHVQVSSPLQSSFVLASSDYQQQQQQL